MTRPVSLDLTRLVKRARFSTPTGIDRVERAYARYYLDQYDGPTEILVHVPLLGDRRVRREKARAFLSRLDAQWSESGSNIGWNAIAELVTGTAMRRNPDKGITIIPSHQHLHSKQMLIKRRGNGRLVLFIHDAIPSEFPEYARAGGGEKHRRRLTNALSQACGIIVNSEDTAARLGGYLTPGSRMPPVQIAHIGLDPLPPADQNMVLPTKPYFVIVGTIEPRKNHMLLLHLWRQFAQQGISPLPNLVVVGRRGWENENILDLIDRSDFLRGHVTEFTNLGDAQLSALVRGCNALLMPSFAEGYGMPIAEALAAGIPVIASDLPVFREVAGDIPDYRNPIDGPGWASAILDYTNADSVLRPKQLGRLKGWTPPHWDTHFAKVTEFIDGLDA